MEVLLYICCLSEFYTDNFKEKKNILALVTVDTKTLENVC